MPYRDVQAAVIAALADHARPNHPSWQDMFDPIAARLAGKERLADPEAIAPRITFRTGLSGMEEVAGEAAIILKHMARMHNSTHIALLVMRHNTQWPSDLYDRAQKLVEADCVALLNLHHRFLLRRCVKEALYPSKDDGARLPMSYIADKTGVHRNTVRAYWQRLLPWVITETGKAYAELTDRLEVAGLIGVETV